MLKTLVFVFRGDYLDFFDNPHQPKIVQPKRTLKSNTKTATVCLPSCFLFEFGSNSQDLKLFNVLLSSEIPLCQTKAFSA